MAQLKVAGVSTLHGPASKQSIIIKQLIWNVPYTKNNAFYFSKGKKYNK